MICTHLITTFFWDGRSSVFLACTSVKTTNSETTLQQPSSSQHKINLYSFIYTCLRWELGNDQLTTDLSPRGSRVYWMDRAFWLRCLNVSELVWTRSLSRGSRMWEHEHTMDQASGLLLNPEQRLALFFNIILIVFFSEETIFTSHNENFSNQDS
jgi:hypothetical protein